jgi:mannitol/fructose-specific phosphotransferase system IIA component (Ntr-type)
MSLGDLFVCTTVLDGGPALDKAEVVGRLLALLTRAGHIPHAEVLAVQNALLWRERLGSTGIGGGVAIPHARHAAVRRPTGVLAVFRPPVGFDALDGEPVDIVALVLSPPDQPGQHLGESSRGWEGLSRHLADADFCRRLRQARSGEEVEDLVQAPAGGMTRRQWLACTDPAAMLRLLRDRRLLTGRKARLFGAACCRRLWGLLSEEGRRAVEAVERYAAGLAQREELDAARRAFTGDLGEGSVTFSPARVAVSYLLADPGPHAFGCALHVSAWAARAGGDQAAGLATHADILRCLFGPPPFRPAEIRPEWLTFGGGIVPNLARCIRDEGAFDRLPILADALEEAGCTDAGILAHLRGPGPHARGCHVLDRLPNKG